VVSNVAGDIMAAALRINVLRRRKSASETRTYFAETLVGAGSAVPGAFRSHAAECRSAAAAEPVEVDHDDPDDGWKADASRIDARVTGMLQNPYRSSGY